MKPARRKRRYTTLSRAGLAELDQYFVSGTHKCPRARRRSCSSTPASAAPTEKVRDRGALSLTTNDCGACYAATSSRVLLTTTFPMVICGGLVSAVSSFSSRTQVDAMRVDSSA